MHVERSKASKKPEFLKLPSLCNSWMKAFAAVELPAAYLRPQLRRCLQLTAFYCTTAENVFQEQRLLVADSHPSRAVGTAVRQHASLWQFREGVLDAYSSYYYLSSVHLFFFLYTVHILISLPQLFLYCILQRNFPRLPLLFACYSMGLRALGCPLLL